MERRALALFVLSTLALAGCTPPAPDTTQIDREAIKADVTAWLQTFWGTWADGGAGFDRGIAMYDDGPDFFLASDGAVWRSLVAADEAFRPAFQAIQNQTFNFEPTTIAVLGPELALVGQSGTFVQNNADGTTAGPNQFAVTMVLSRTSGVWKVRFYHQSEPNVPAPKP